MEATVTEIHDYPHRPAGFEEPLFWDLEDKREAMEHYLATTWVQRASEIATKPIGRGPGEAAHARNERVRIERREDDTLVLERECGQRRRRRSVRKSVRKVLASWREVRGWWESGGCDLTLYRLLLSDGAVVDVAWVRGEKVWKLVGVVD